MRDLGSSERLEQRRRRAMSLLKSVNNVSMVSIIVRASVSSVFRFNQALQHDGSKGLRAKPAPGRPARLSKRQKENLARLLLMGPRAAGYRTEFWTLSELPS
jgi:transposase